MKSFKIAMSVLALIPTLSSAQELKVRDGVTKPKTAITPFHQLGVFKMGGREQRVRVFLTDEYNPQTEGANADKYVFDGYQETASPALSKIQNDPLANNSAHCAVGTICNATSAVIDPAYNKPENKGTEWAGIILNPHVFLCSAKALEQVRRVMDANPGDTKLMQIDEVNIIVNAINGAPEEHDLELSRGDVAAIKNDPALNYSIPLIVGVDGHAKCGIVSDEKFAAAWARLVAEAKK